MLLLVFLRLCVSLADMNTAISFNPAASARSKPLAFGTSAETVTPGGSTAAFTSWSASASCGTQRGETKLVSSMRVSPAAKSARSSSSLPSSGMGAASFCSPSRGETS